jgi:hypothetical protein
LWGKARLERVRCESGRRAKANHCRRVEILQTTSKPGPVDLAREQPGGYLFTARVVSGMEVA